MSIIESANFGKIFVEQKKKTNQESKEQELQNIEINMEKISNEEKILITRLEEDRQFFEYFSQENNIDVTSIESIGTSFPTYKITTADGMEFIFKPEGSYKSFIENLDKNDTENYKDVKEDYKKEYSNYLIDRRLKLNVSAPVLLIGIQGQKGTIQKFKPNCITLFEMSRDEEKNMPIDQMCKMALLDEVTLNKDRHEGNILFDRTKQECYAIDHDDLYYSKPNERWMSAVINTIHLIREREEQDTIMSLDEIQETLDNISQELQDSTLQKDLKNLCGHYLSQKQLADCIQRLENIIHNNGINLKSIGVPDKIFGKNLDLLFNDLDDDFDEFEL